MGILKTIAFASLALTGCFSPALDGKFSCGVNDSCPPGLTCREGICGQPTDAGTKADPGKHDSATLAPDAATPVDSATAPVDASTPCKPATCAANACGTIGDGCGGTLACGDCVDGKECGVKMPNKCDAPVQCVPTTCAKLKANCGEAPDGCGGTLTCGTCASDKTCGEEHPNKCD